MMADQLCWVHSNKGKLMQMISRKKIIRILLVVVVFSAGVLSGIQYNKRSYQNDILNTTSLDVRKLATIYEQVLDLHVAEDIKQDDMEVNAIKGMLKEVDGGLTRYQTAKEYEASQRTSIRGDYAGIGVVISTNDGVMTIVAPYKNTPAERAGLKTGDIITGVNGESIEGWSIGDVGDTVRGPIGTDVTLTIKPADGGDIYDVTLTRATIEVPVVNQQMVGPNQDISHVSLYIFNNHSVEQLQAAVEDSLQQGAEYLILDLRGNPGGNLTACLGVADLFLPADKTIFVTRDRINQQFIYQTKKDSHYDIPILVLINKGSASASEVITGTLMDNNRATSMGTNSFGKASMQSGYDLPDGDFLWITTNTYLTPNGDDIDKVGIKPDIELPEELLMEARDNIDQDIILDYAVNWIGQQR